MNDFGEFITSLLSLKRYDHSMSGCLCHPECEGIQENARGDYVMRDDIEDLLSQYQDH